MDDNQPEMFVCKYLARNGNGHSNVMAYEEAVNWANTRLANGTVQRVYLLRVVSTLARAEAPIVATPGFVPEVRNPVNG